MAALPSAPDTGVGSVPQSPQSQLRVSLSERTGPVDESQARDAPAHATVEEPGGSGGGPSEVPDVPVLSTEGIHVKEETEVKREYLDDDPLDERVRWLQAELKSVTEELNRRKKAQVKKEIKEEDPAISLAVKQGASENGRFMIDLTGLLDD